MSRKTVMPQFIRFYNLLTASIVACALALIAKPVWAQQVKAGKILQQSIEATNVSTKAMDDMWTNLFAEKSMLYNQVVFLATALLVVGFFFFMISFAHALQSNNKERIIKIVGWGLAISILLQNNGEVLKVLTVNSRGFINKQTTAILRVNIGQLTIQDAMQDVILTDQVRDQVKEAFSDCEAKEGDAQLVCLEEGAKEAALKVKEYEDQGFIPPGVRRLDANIRLIEEDVIRQRAEGNFGNGPRSLGRSINEWDRQVSSLIWQSATNSGSREFLKSFQNWFTYGFEFAMLLTGLLGPLAVAASAIPKEPRALFSWIIAFFSIGMLKLSYNLLIGFAAVYASQAEMQDLGSSGFLLMMSIGAPLISIAVAGGGGAAIFFALGRTTAMVTTFIPIGGSAAGAMARR